MPVLSSPSGTFPPHPVRDTVRVVSFARDLTDQEHYRRSLRLVSSQSRKHYRSLVVNSPPVLCRYVSPELSVDSRHHLLHLNSQPVLG